MGKHKQLVISRFFAPKSNPPPSSSNSPPPPSPPPKISATVDFSPSKRARTSQFLSNSPLKPSKRPNLSPHTQNPTPSSIPQSNPTLHQKFLQKLLEPPDHLLEPSTQNPSPPISSNPKYTPLEQQVVELKEKYPDVVLMIEVGYKYRFFGKDAEIAARVLGIYAHVDHSFLTASVPTFRLNVHVRRLVGEGYKVGVVKQTETASIKAHGSNRLGPFCRGLSALYTRATIEAAEDLGGVGGEESCGSLSNYLFCVVEREVLPENGDCGVGGGFHHVKIGVVAVEISTGEMVYGEFNDNFVRSGLEAVLLSLFPAELLLGEPLSKQTTKLLLAYAGPASKVRVERASYDLLKDGGALTELMALYEETGEEEPEQNKNCTSEHAVGTQENPIKSIMAMPGLAAQALALTFQHLKQFGLERILLLGASFRSFSSSMEMSLSANALQQLEVGEAREKVHLVNEKLEVLIQSYRKQLRMKNLEFLSVSGSTHLIELSSEARVPSSWVKVNSTKKTVRYHPPEVLTALNELSLANEKLTLVCRAAWNSFLGEFAKHYPEFQACVQALAALDCLHSLAILSRNKDYVRPAFVDDNEPVQIQITCGRHPVLESMLQDNFVPNDTTLCADREYCQIITGPNMGGKSCYIRQVALIAIMAQVGSFVPARAAKLHVLDGIHTRMGASDNIQQGRSTFLEELSEASHIIRNCTPKSLVIMDELGRGTSTHDGVAIAYATLHYLLEQKKCMVLFVTHYPKIADIRKEFPVAVGTYHVSYLTSKTDNSAGAEGYMKEPEDVTYLYKLVPGISERSFAFKVAQLAQLPVSCIQKGIVMAAKLERLVQQRKKNGSIVPDCQDHLSGVCSVLRFLNSALGIDDVETAFGYLKDAQNCACQTSIKVYGKEHLKVQHHC